MPVHPASRYPNKKASVSKSRSSMSVRVKRKKVKRKKPETIVEVPEQSFVLPPEPGPCRKRACDQDPCWVHCRDDRAKDHQHELNPHRMGWARGRGDGRFDVYCGLCGEVGIVHLKPQDLDVDWGDALVEEGA